MESRTDHQVYCKVSRRETSGFQNAQAQKEVESEDMKNCFNEELQCVYGELLKHYTTILLLI